MNERPEISMTGRQRLLQTLLALVAVALFVLVGNRYFGELHRIVQANWIGIAGITIVYVATVWTQSRTIRIGLQAFDHKISDRESFSLFVVGSTINLVLPRTGIGSTALYLSRVRRVPLFDYGSVVLYNVGLFVFCSSFVGFVAFATYWMISGVAPAPLLMAVIPAAMLASGLALSVRWSFPRNWKFPGVNIARKLVRATGQLNGSPEMWSMARTHMALVFLRALRLLIAFWAMGIPVNFLPVLMASVLGDLLFVIAITPGAIGFREAAIAMSATWLGTTVPIALAVALLDRIVFSLTVVIISQFVWRSLFGKSHENPTPDLTPSETDQPTSVQSDNARCTLPDAVIGTAGISQGVRS